MAPPRTHAAAAAAAAAIARASGLTATRPTSTTPAAPAVAASSLAASAKSHSYHLVRLLSFNLWFEPLAMATRMAAIGRYVETLRPAVIGFQEVTRESLAMLRNQRWARFYDCSLDTAPPFSEAYFVVLFSALPVLSLETLPFANTGMGRELLAFNVEVAPGKSLLVATSHLESLPQFKRERVSQLQQSLQFLSERVDAAAGESLGAVLMGDTNLLRGDLALLDRRCVADAVTVEEAKTGRSKCRKCSDAIAKGATRVGKVAKDRLPTGKVVEITMWFHQECFLGHGMMPEAEKQFVRQWQSAGDRNPSVSEMGVDQQVVDIASLGLPPRWKDLWLSVGGNSEENGYTYDGKKNTMIKNKAYQSRLDRAYFYPGEVLAAFTDPFHRIEMVGTEPIADGLWASDHFGLLTTFRFEAAEESDKTEAKRKRGDKDEQEEEKDHASTRGSKRAPIELE